MTENKEPTAAEIKAVKEEEETDKLVSKKIETIFKENNRALQTYLVVSEFGIIPKVRLTKVENEEKKPKEKK